MSTLDYGLPNRRLSQWQCEICGMTYVVPSLARQCEDDHLATK